MHEKYANSSSLLMKNIIKVLAQSIESHIPSETECTGPEGKGNVKACVLVSTARQIIENIDTEYVPQSNLEDDLENLFEGGRFSIEVTKDRGKFYVEIADDWTGYIKRIFSANTFLGAISMASRKKDEADLIHTMDGKHEVDVDAETASEEGDEEGEEIAATLSGFVPARDTAIKDDWGEENREEVSDSADSGLENEEESKGA